jgi:sn-glycerol 3-phosphate transport system substrate-binding protein
MSNRIDRRTLLKAGSALAAAPIGGPSSPRPALAQGKVEVSFFYPVAVGGPITRLIDTYAADFAKENPAITVKPIYAGTYQETIVKAITAHKSGTPPVTSVLLSTDMFTLIDEDAIVPFDDFIKSDADKAWLASFFPASWKTARPAARPGAFRSSARPSCSTGTRSCSRRPVSIPRSRRRPGPSRSPSPRS